VNARPQHESLEAVRHQLRPLFDRVVIKELDQDRMRRSGLVVPPGSHDPPPQHGIVLAVGPGLDWWEQAGVEMPIGPGDHVVFPATAGAWIEVDEERLLVCRVTELLGVLESAVDDVMHGVAAGADDTAHVLARLHARPTVRARALGDREAGVLASPGLASRPRMTVSV
jgi:chaperonin GroES